MTAEHSALRVLWLGTKSPWPARDGGRLVVLESLVALRALGVEVTLVAPVEARSATVEEQLATWARPRLVVSRPRGLLTTLVSSWRDRLPLPLARHRHAVVAQRVEELVQQEAFDLVHVEQVQALASLPSEECLRLPVVVRAQNVESDLWRARLARRLGQRWAAKAGRRFEAWEGARLAGVAGTIALSEQDRERLGRLAEGRGRFHVLPVPFPSQLPAGAPLPGDPAVVLLAGGWWPNGEGARWFLEQGWPEVVQARPEARLHLFGVEADGLPTGVVGHQSPTESVVAMAEGALLLVPLQVASGIRMKILEGWARGLPVVATPTAAAGLAAFPGQTHLEAEDPAGLARQVLRLANDYGLRRQLQKAGRQHLEEHHDPTRWARATVEFYRSCVESTASG